jgi:alpha-1,2-mannosyltransferase
MDDGRAPATTMNRIAFHILVWSGVVVCLLVFVALCKPWIMVRHFSVGAPIGRDFANFWMGGHLALAGQLDLLVDFPAYNELMSRTFDYGWADGFAYAYPPHTLFLTIPFALFPYSVAVYLWTAVNVAAIAATVRLLRGDWRIVLLACLSPAALTMVMFGHFGGLLAFLAVFALLRADKQPALSGLCLALASVKPQFAMAVGLLLVFTGRWRVVMWSVPAGLFIFGASIVAFGVKPWFNFFEGTVTLHAKLLAQYIAEMLRTLISVYAGMRLAGAPGWLAQIAQYAFSIVVMAKAAHLIVRQGVDARTIALGLAAALAALPYVNGYDLAIVVPAFTLALFAAPAVPIMPLPAALMLWLLPPLTIPFGLMESPVLAAVFAGVLLVALFARPQVEGRHQPVATSPGMLPPLPDLPVRQ